MSGSFVFTASSSSSSEPPLQLQSTLPAAVSEKAMQGNPLKKNPLPITGKNSDYHSLRFSSMSNAGSFSSTTDSCGSFGVTKNRVPAMSFSSEPSNFNSLNTVSSAPSYDSGRLKSPFHFSGPVFSVTSTANPAFGYFSSTVSSSGIATIPCGVSSIPAFSSTPNTSIPSLPSFGPSVSSTPLTFPAFSCSGLPFSSTQVTVPAFTSSNSAMSSSVTESTITIPTLFSSASTEFSSTATMSTPILAPLVAPFEQLSVKTTPFCTSGMVFSSTTDTIPAFPSWGSASSSAGMSALPNSRILKGIPQNPHFRTLQSYSKKALKNLISGWDQTFEETVDQIHNLRVENFWTSVDELWKTLEELESLGYNVNPLRNRLNKLTDSMMKRKASEFEISALRKKAEYHREEKNRMEGEISKLQVQVEKEKVGIKEVVDQVTKMEEHLPVGDGVFETLAMAPL